MKSLVAMFSLAVVAAGCSLLPGHGQPSTWVDPEAHIVDGYWIGTERPCTGTCDESARRAVDAASLEFVGRSARFVVADGLQEYVAGDGRLGALGESRPPMAVQRNVVIDSPDRTRHLVTLFCRTPDVDPSVTVETCEVSPLVIAPRVGEEPWMGSGT
jgi:hypothetical protein